MAESDSDISKEPISKKIVTKDYSAKKTTLNKGVFLLVFAVLIASVSFYGGTVYEKDHPSSSSTSINSTSNSQSNYGGNGGGYGRYGGFSSRVFGQVTAISSSSISIQDNRTGTTVTLAITSNTQITDSGQSASASDIQTGDTVIASKSSSNSSDAATIMVNPSFGGYGGGTGSGTPQSDTGSGSVPNISTN